MLKKTPKVLFLAGFLLAGGVMCGTRLVAAQPFADQPATDTLGDPLPAHARLRLGTLRFRPPATVAELALTPDETTIVSIGDDLIAWDAATGKERWRAHGDDFGFDPPAAAYGMRALAFSHDGAQFYTPGRRNEVVVWETSTGRRKVVTVVAPNPVPEIPQQGAARSVDVTPDGQKLAVGNSRGLVVCDLLGKQRYAIANAPERPLLVAPKDRLTFFGDYTLGRFSPDGKILAVVKSDSPEEIGLYESETGQHLRSITLMSRLVRLAFSPDDSGLATTGAATMQCGFIDVETGNRALVASQALTDPPENYTSAIAFSPDGKTIAAGATDCRIYLFSVPLDRRRRAAACRSRLVSLGIGVLLGCQQDALLPRGGTQRYVAGTPAARNQLPLPAGVRK